MTSFIVGQKFHSVGNGTFKSGVVMSLDTREAFQWVYDCGSTSMTTLNRVLGAITRRGWPESIDMLVLSHFDNDHVNGVEEILRHCRVKTLVLPFSEWAQTVREISVMGKKGTSPSTALMQLNPVKWLTSRNFDAHVEEIVLVQGGTETSPVPYGDDAPEPEPGDFQRDDDVRRFSQNYFSLGSALTGASRIRILRHDRSIQALNREFEFVFYNAEKDFNALGLIEQQSGQWYAKHSGNLLSDVKTDIQNTIMSINLHQPLSTMPAGWRKTLKNCYESHFGHTGKAKNNISLCMYAAPIRATPSQFHVRDYHRITLHANNPTVRLATLCTGDIHLTSSVISDIQNHLGTQRWDRIGLVQVPHHGSQHSWEPGNAGLLAPAQFVHCASGTKHHPHPLVQADLRSSSVHTADRKQSVYVRYRF